MSSQVDQMQQDDAPAVVKKDEHEKEDAPTETNSATTAAADIEGDANVLKKYQEMENPIEVSSPKSLTAEHQEKGSSIENKLSSAAFVTVGEDRIGTLKEQKKETDTEKISSISPTEVYSTNNLSSSVEEEEENAVDVLEDDQSQEVSTGANTISDPIEVSPKTNKANPQYLDVKENEDDTQKVDREYENEEGKPQDLKNEEREKEVEKLDVQKEDKSEASTSIEQENEGADAQIIYQVEATKDIILLRKSTEIPDAENERVDGEMCENEDLRPAGAEGVKQNREGNPNDEEETPVSDGIEVPSKEAVNSASTNLSDLDQEKMGSAWPGKAEALKNFVREKSVVAMVSVLRRFGKSDGGENVHNGEDDKSVNSNESSKEVVESQKGSEAQHVFQKAATKSGWNPLGLIGFSHDGNAENKTNQKDFTNKSAQQIPTKGTILLYTRSGCHDCKAARQFLRMKRLRYVEINLDVYPSRKLELKKMVGSSAVPRVFFNEVDIGGLAELKGLDESGKLDEKIEYVSNEGPSREAPIPPVSGEDDVSSTADTDELAVIVLKMKNVIVIRDRFYRLRRFTNCFLGSEALDFLSEDQHLEREEAIEFGRKLACKLFLQHVLDENVFEDGNHLYRFLDQDPIVSQCQNIPRGIIDVKPKPITELSSRLRILLRAIFEAYTSEDGKHVDYRSIHGSEEFARYLRITEELQRVDLPDISREEKISFFINLYNMMVIHAILVWGYPSGALERRKFLGDFKYVIGGCTYSVSAIHNGILRANQRPPYNFIKLFGAKDKRLKVTLSNPEPLVHFALVCGNRSGPALRCYSPENIDEELKEAARTFLRSGGLVLDVNAKVASVSKIIRWYSIDFGKNEVDVLKYVSKYMEPAESEALLKLLADSQLKVVYQPYDLQLNN